MIRIKYLIVGYIFTLLNTNAAAQIGNRDAQLEAIRNEIKANPNDPNAAKDLVKNYTKEFKKDANALVLLGNVYFGAKQYDKATMYADMALAKNKNCGNAFILKGDIAAVSQDDGGEAAGWYQQAMTIDPKNPEGYMRYANVYRKRSPEESERALNELRRNIPDFPVEAEAAHTFYGTGNYDKAFEHFSKADRSKINEDQLAEYALTAMYIDKKDEALELAKYGIGKFPENVSFIRLALINAIGTNKYADAVAYAEDLIKREGDDNAGDITYYGQALAGVKKFDEAIAQYQKALQLDDKNLKPLEYISEAYFGKGETDKALQYANEYLEKDDNARISDYDKLANIYMSLVKDSVDRQDNFAKAMAVYDKVVTKFPQRATWAHSQKATAAFIAEMEDEYPQLYKVVIDELENKSDRTAAETQYLASAYRSMGYHFWASKNDLNAALPYFEKLVKLSPDNSLATKFFEAWEKYTEWLLVQDEPKSKTNRINIKFEKNSKKIMNGPEIFKQYNSAVFIIYTSDSKNEYQGSGFFIDNQGLGVSNYHVFKNTIKGQEIIRKVDSDHVYKIIEIIAIDDVHDFILFRVNCNNNNYLKIAHDKPEVGEKVYAIGSPRGLENTFSSGEISQWRSNSIIQTNVQIDHGSSGGPLINQYGLVVGITSGTFYDGSQANLNYAWSIDVIKPILNNENK